eukprot:scaffold5470_cov199-Alexandrium_tamarense.AAC.6
MHHHSTSIILIVNTFNINLQPLLWALWEQPWALVQLWLSWAWVWNTVTMSDEREKEAADDKLEL